MNEKQTTTTASAQPENVRTYYEIKIVETGAQLFSSDYSTFNIEKKHFATVAECKAYLKEHYGKAKRGRMFRDLTDGRTIECGWIYKFRNADWSHAPVVPWNQCDLVSISRIEQTAVNP